MLAMVAGYFLKCVPFHLSEVSTFVRLLCQFGLIGKPLTMPFARPRPAERTSCSNTTGYHDTTGNCAAVVERKLRKECSLSLSLLSSGLRAATRPQRHGRGRSDQNCQPASHAPPSVHQLSRNTISPFLKSGDLPRPWSIRSRDLRYDFNLRGGANRRSARSTFQAVCWLGFSWCCRSHRSCTVTASRSASHSGSAFGPGRRLVHPTSTSASASSGRRLASVGSRVSGPASPRPCRRVDADHLAPLFGVVDATAPRSCLFLSEQTLKSCMVPLAGDPLST